MQFEPRAESGKLAADQSFPPRYDASMEENPYRSPDDAGDEEPPRRRRPAFLALFACTAIVSGALASLSIVVLIALFLAIALEGSKPPAARLYSGLSVVVLVGVLSVWACAVSLRKVRHQRRRSA